ncbi:MAG: DNA methyltransferase, partial [Ktedonobacteraceae bacterium]
VSLLHYENLLIFLDTDRSQSLWYWVKRLYPDEHLYPGKSLYPGEHLYPSEHLYVKGQPGDLSLSKLEAMFFDASDFDESGNVSVAEVAIRLRKALDVERVTKKFYEDFKQERDDFLEEIAGIDDERDRRWYASVLLNRLMFIYFLQRKLFLDHGNRDYLQDKLAESRARGANLYYSEFLNALFFEGFAKPEEERSEAARKLLGDIVYLNGGLFLLHPVEKRWPRIQVSDRAFESLLRLFGRYSWNLDDTPGGQDDEISPHVLGYIFEKYINQKSFGAYYTRPEITAYLCERTIHKLILEKINAVSSASVGRKHMFETIEELLMNLDARLCRELLDILPKISLLDPACGSGAFLVSAMNTLIKVYGAITGKIEYLSNAYLTAWLQRARAEHRSLSYYIKKKIITENLFGVDIMEEATEIARLRLFLALVSSAQSVDQLEPLPNIDFNILHGNSLIGFLHVNEEVYDQRQVQLNLFQKRFQEVVDEKNRQIQAYKSTSRYTKDLRALRDTIQDQREEAMANLNELLLDEFKQLGIKYEQATWDTGKNADGRSVKRAVTVADIAGLQPFHWGYEFDQVMNHRGGFDVIITNPPWEILKPQAKEFFALHSKLVSKNKMRIEDFETERTKLLRDAEIRAAWLDYQSTIPYQSAYFRAAPAYRNQSATVNGKKTGTDINLYKLFTEQCYNLLREGGQCGIVIPSGIYTDLGAKQLREMLFTRAEVTGLFCFENSKGIFEEVHRSYKFVALTYEKGGQTTTFPAAFMRHDAGELERFPKNGALTISVDLIRRLSPDSLSVMEFKSEMDVAIAQKMLKNPLLGEKQRGTWNLVLTREFDMTNDSNLFKTEAKPDRLALYEGKMIHQFTHQWGKPRYWVNEKEGRTALLKRKADIGQGLDYQFYRLGYRGIGRTTDQRALIATVLPAYTFAGNSLIVSRRIDPGDGNHEIIDDSQMLFVTAVMNSYIADYFIGQKISANLNMFYIYQLPVPRLTKQDFVFTMIVERTARLVCTMPEFKALW